MRPPAARLVALSLACLLPFGCGDAAPPTDARPDRADDHAAMDHGAMDHGASSYSDLAFLDDMTVHHAMAVDMAALADRAGAGDDVRRLAAAMVASQQAEIDSMRAWRARWFDGAPPPDAHSPADMAAMGMAGMDMDALGMARGADFDRVFLTQMIPHHAGAITMAADALAHSERPEIRRLAGEIIAAQAREVGQMQTWLDAAGERASG